MSVECQFNSAEAEESKRIMGFGTAPGSGDQRRRPSPRPERRFIHLWHLLRSFLQRPSDDNMARAETAARTVAIDPLSPVDSASSDEETARHAAVRSTVSLDALSAMDDQELSQFMRQHHSGDRNYTLSVDGQRKLSDDERSRLAQRLVNLAQGLNANSHPLDLNELDVRLGRLRPNYLSNARNEPHTGSQSASDDESPTNSNMYKTVDEINAYNELIRDGGRPVYAIDIIQDVFTDPDSYRDMLRPWQEHLTQTSPSGVFQRQLRSWQGFRQWQRDNRNRKDSDDAVSFLTYVEGEKRKISQDPLHMSPQGKERRANS
ncbi:uncharacterized protein B0I36DRAFT_356502 [Microdochium trichocladiopsis]|uniref:Uncharacterized protein n=1 Tax=Microdochium trichocladiopsis TaxID=1682393 RepID=A0A9P8XQB6_9PEZI|nr:uncharacterized protein B0I36DRAFT_356502 [Microdochium trichocladiopsis]KAH7010915.1 hypothetical protein B0I36DRAFT_356502 [Microdochium trichocladiopsis]